MRFTKLLAPNLSSPLSEEEITSLPTEKLMERVSLVSYSLDPKGCVNYLPMGQTVIRNMSDLLHKISREWGIQEMKFNGIQSLDHLESTGRWERFKGDILKLENSRVILSPTHEEHFLNLLRHINLSSHRSLPLFIYQIGDVYRKLKHKSPRGGLRSSEILVYEGYALEGNAGNAGNAFPVFDSVFSRFFGKLDVPYITHKMNGGRFVQYLYETPSGIEDVVCTDEGIDESECSELERDKLKSHRVIDMSQIFINEDTVNRLSPEMKKGEYCLPVNLYSAGLGFYRALFSMIDHHRDDKGLVWPQGIEPFTYGIIPLYPREATHREASERLYEDLTSKGEKVLLYDGTKIGNKKKIMDLIGVQRKIIIHTENGELKIVEEDRKGEIRPYHGN